VREKPGIPGRFSGAREAKAISVFGASAPAGEVRAELLFVADSAVPGRTGSAIRRAVAAGRRTAGVRAGAVTGVSAAISFGSTGAGVRGFAIRPGNGRAAGMWTGRIVARGWTACAR